MSDMFGHAYAAGECDQSVVFFDGMSSRRRLVTVALSDQLKISEDGVAPTLWTYADIRRADSPAGALRLSCTSAPPLARLEVRNERLASEIVGRCSRLDENMTSSRGVVKIVGWSVAAVVSIVGVVLFGVPLAADRLAPLVPASVERRIGDAAEVQVKAIFSKGEVCDNAAGQAAFTKLVNQLRNAAGLDASVASAVLPTPVPNAFALPGGKVFLLKGLLDKAENVDEVAGVLAHELGHLKHYDNMRALIYNGGTSFLIGLLFGDVTGSSAVIFASRSVVQASYSREAEQGADTFAIEVMRKLGRSPKPMAELIFRVTGKQGGSGLSILASHPLTQDRLERMKKVDQPASAPPLLTEQEWTALKGICGKGEKI